MFIAQVTSPQMARGGNYAKDSAAASLEHLETYLTAVFAFIGVKPEFVIADGLNMSTEQRATSIRHALGETARLAA